MERVDFETGTFYLGDCFDVMSTLAAGSVDMVCTDPPYGMDFQSNYRSPETTHAKIAGDDGNLDWLPEFIGHAERMSRKDTAHYFFCSHHKIGEFRDAIAARFKVKNLLVWEKNNTSMGDLTGDFAPKLEFCWFAHKGRTRIRGRRDPNIMKFARTANDLHPTQKPVELIQYLVEKFSDAGNIVFDPFAGSGTTAVAAIQSGRRWVCIERDPTYFNLALARVWEAEANRPKEGH